MKKNVGFWEELIGEEWWVPWCYPPLLIGGLVQWEDPSSLLLLGKGWIPCLSQCLPPSGTFSDTGCSLPVFYSYPCSPGAETLALLSQFLLILYLLTSSMFSPLLKPLVFPFSTWDYLSKITTLPRQRTPFAQIHWITCSILLCCLLSWSMWPKTMAFVPGSGGWPREALIGIGRWCKGVARGFSTAPSKLGL